MGVTISRDELARLFPRPKSGERRIIWDNYVAGLCSPEGAELLERFEVTTSSLRWAHFAATIGVETGGLTILWESGAYSAEGLIRVFGGHRHSARLTPKEAKRLARNGPAIFERVYGLGNPKKAAELGNTEPGDGWRFRGLGYNQMTGRWAHTRAASRIGCSMDALPQPVNLLHAALLEWKDKGCNEHADKDDVIAVRKLINAGSLRIPERNLNGVPQARMYLASAKAIMWDAKARPKPVDTDLAIGATGERVKELQRELTESGFPCGGEDGQFGQLTERALAGFQVAYGLRGTGRADAATWAALEAAGPAAPIRDLTVSDLAQRGSKTIRLWTRVMNVGRVIYTTMFGTAIAEASGIDVIEQVTNSAERVGTAMGKIDLTGGLGDPRALIMGGLVLAGFIGWLLTLWAKAGADNRLDETNYAINIGR